MYERLYGLAQGLDQLLQSLSSGTPLDTLREDDWVGSEPIDVLELHAQELLAFAESWRDQCLEVMNRYYGTSHTAESIRVT